MDRPGGGPATTSLNSSDERTSGRSDYIHSRCRPDLNGGKHYEAGDMVKFASVEPQWQRVDMLCPYCERPLNELVNTHELRDARVVRGCSGGAVCDGVSELVPLTHRRLSCGRCKTSFFQPKEAA